MNSTTEDEMIAKLHSLGTNREAPKPGRKIDIPRKVPIYAGATVSLLCIGAFVGLIALPRSENPPQLSPTARDWLILEISTHRDMTPGAAARLLDQQLAK
ncbi:hypothetical protein Q4525_18975 [Shimia thalassica]|uniref:hypothetical protein n=1 Tax=Shimia thalassica TaxID=1715693 RepID=UPI001C0A2DBC|nr:hypothetical protein [Shimia thalassica]MBU2942695.1 hypothetical protein [Shimia thalassica]MDO6485813.1 hypothetical protein [Shimia thalassica]MDO6505026.1 hypothetical protein [Shimia thalassica]